MTPLFEMQRTMINQNRKAIEDGIEAQKTAMSAMVDGIESSRDLAERNVELSRSTMHDYLDAVENVTPEDATDFDALRESVDESFEAFEEGQSGAWESMHETIEESNVAFGEFADSYMETVDSSFDAFLESYDQFEESVDTAAEGVEVPVQAE
jgi:hypothetical protein